MEIPNRKDVKALEDDAKQKRANVILEAGNYKVSIPFAAAALSNLVKTAYEVEAHDDTTPFPVDMRQETLLLIGEYLLHMDGVAPEFPVVPLKTPTQIETWVNDPWLVGWLQNIQENLPRWQMFDLLRQANYMDIPSLLRYRAALLVRTAAAPSLQHDELIRQMDRKFIKSQDNKSFVVASLKKDEKTEQQKDAGEPATKKAKK